MKSNFKILSTILLATLFLSATPKSKIEPFFIEFKSTEKLNPSEPDVIQKDADKFKIVETDLGAVKVSRLEGYKISYITDQRIAAVNLKVELSDKKSYDKDQMNLINNFRFINSNLTDVEAKDLIELEYNGYKIYGYSKSNVGKVGALGTFVMFPGEGVVVYFDFYNISPESALFKSVDQYKKQRTAFLEEYTKFIKENQDILLAQKEELKAKKDMKNNKTGFTAIQEESK